MRSWLKWLIIVVVVVVVAYGAFVAYAEYSNGTQVNLTLHLGTEGSSGKMYMRCDGSTPAGVCSGGDQPTITVRARDRVTITLINDDKGDHSHDFNLVGAAYALPPISPEMELHQSTESWTFTAYATGTYRMICEIGGHDAAGMHATFVVK